MSNLEKRNCEVLIAALQSLQAGYQEDGVTALQCMVGQQGHWVKTDTRKAPRLPSQAMEQVLLCALPASVGGGWSFQDPCGQSPK